MGGRFGKYGDFKRKVRIRQSRLLKRDVALGAVLIVAIIYWFCLKIQGAGKPQVSIEIRPAVSPQQSGEETGRHCPVKKSD